MARQGIRANQIAQMYMERYKASDITTGEHTDTEDGLSIKTVFGSVTPSKGDYSIPGAKDNNTYVANITIGGSAITLTDGTNSINANISSPNSIAIKDYIYVTLDSSGIKINDGSLTATYSPLVMSGTTVNLKVNIAGNSKANFIVSNELPIGTDVNFYMIRMLIPDSTNYYSGDAYVINQKGSVNSHNDYYNSDISNTAKSRICSIIVAVYKDNTYNTKLVELTSLKKIK